MRKFPKDFLLRNAIIPLTVDVNTLVVIASQPEKDGLESSIREHVSYDINYNVGLRRNINDAVKEFYDKALTEVPADRDPRKERIGIRDIHLDVPAKGEDQDVIVVDDELD